MTAQFEQSLTAMVGGILELIPWRWRLTQGDMQKFSTKKWLQMVIVEKMLKIFHFLLHFIARTWYN
jgi:hypothetical protein